MLLHHRLDCNMLQSLNEKFNRKNYLTIGCNLYTTTTLLRGRHMPQARAFWVSQNMRKHMNCFSLNVNTSFKWLVYTQLKWKYGSWPASDLCFWLAVHVCIFSMCTSCVSVRVWGTCHVPVCAAELWRSHCVLGKAIGRPGRVIKVKLLPPRLFLPACWDNRRGSPSLLLFHTHPAFLLALLSDCSNSIYIKGVEFHAKE